ncbi:MAG: hypothetical protein ABI181_15300 [Mycobacteriaceae bacterium]
MSDDDRATPRAGRRPEFSDAQICAQLRAAAATHGDPLSVSRYDSGDHEPSSARIIQRFGAWSTACAAAGLHTRAASRSYARAFDEQAVVAAVGRYLAEPAVTGSYAGYSSWAKQTPDVPSAQTVRNTCGSWVAAKAAAKLAATAGVAPEVSR